jgi:hypothetical protein
MNAQQNTAAEIKIETCDGENLFGFAKTTPGSILSRSAPHSKQARQGLPDGIFSSKKSKFG